MFGIKKEPELPKSAPYADMQWTSCGQYIRVIDTSRGTYRKDNDGKTIFEPNMVDICCISNNVSSEIRIMLVRYIIDLHNANLAKSK